METRKYLIDQSDLATLLVSQQIPDCLLISYGVAPGNLDYVLTIEGPDYEVGKFAGLAMYLYVMREHSQNDLPAISFGSVIGTPVRKLNAGAWK